MKALVALALAGLAGCAVLHPAPESWEVHPVSKAGAEVQAATFKKKGLLITASDPTGNGLPSIHLGTLECTVTRVPMIPRGASVPSVTSTSEVDANTGAHVRDVLEVGTYEAGASDPPATTPAPDAGTEEP